MKWSLKKHLLLYNTQKTLTFTSKLPFSHHHFHKHPLMRWLVGSLKKTPINLSGGKSLCAFIFKAKPLGSLSNKENTFLPPGCTRMPQLNQTMHPVLLNNSVFKNVVLITNRNCIKSSTTFSHQRFSLALAHHTQLTNIHCANFLYL